uniref:Uncharacterized protein n=1 Tax=Tanacetum cinerariifolium TaxID=118510 RepID=A0A6L2LR08_TANCI|nr:hypothetical protein [Tanacetum cinerariifolium]
MAEATVKDYTKLVVTDGIVDYVLEKYRNNWNCDDEIAYFILEDLWLKYGKCDKGKEKEAEYYHLKVNKDDKRKGKVHVIQTIVEKLEVDLAMAIKAKQAEHDKGKQLDDVDLDDDLDSLDLENIIKTLKADFGRLLKANEAEEAKLKAKEAEEAELKAKEAMLAEVVQLSSDEDAYSNEGFFGDEDLILFNDVKYPLTDAEIQMFKERPTIFIYPTASTSNTQAASTSFPRGRKIAMTGCVLGLRAPDDRTAPPPSGTRKRKSKK